MPSGDVLFINEVPFWRGESGADHRVGALCQACQESGFSVTVFSPSYFTFADRRLQRQRFAQIRFVHPPWHLLLMRMFRRRLSAWFPIRLPGESSNTPLLWERRHAFQRLCAALQPHAIVMEYLWNAPLIARIKECLPQPPLILLDTHDVMHLRAARFAEHKIHGTPNLSREAEAAIMEPFDVLIAIQDQEADQLRAMCPGKPVITAGHALPVDPPRFHDRLPVRLLFVAARGHHNQQSIQDFLRDVWPFLWERHQPNLELRILGRIAEDLRPETLPPGVIVEGFVDTLDAAYAEADIAINPVYAGSGLKIKNVEALCHGLPLVTTPVGAEGLESGRDSAFWVCEDASGMREALDTLIRNSSARQQLAEAAHRFAKTHLQSEMVYADFISVLRHYRRGD